MNYDEIINEVQKYDDDLNVVKLLTTFKEWKINDATVVELQSTVERFFGHSWIDNEETHNHLYKVWMSFRVIAIEGIGGMTMNERLYWFGLFEQFDSCKLESKKQLIYSKLSANS